MSKRTAAWQSCKKIKTGHSKLPASQPNKQTTSTLTKVTYTLAFGIGGYVCKQTNDYTHTLLKYTDILHKFSTF